jgi:hypothetical protein
VVGSCVNTVMNMRFQILTVVNMKITAFWDIVPCSLNEVCSLVVYFTMLSQ